MNKLAARKIANGDFDPIDSGAEADNMRLWVLGMAEPLYAGDAISRQTQIRRKPRPIDVPEPAQTG